MNPAMIVRGAAWIVLGSAVAQTGSAPGPGGAGPADAPATVSLDRAALHEVRRVSAMVARGDRERRLGLDDVRYQAEAHRHLQWAEHDYRDAIVEADLWTGRNPTDTSAAASLAWWRCRSGGRLEAVLLDDANLMLAAGRFGDALGDADRVLAMDADNAAALAMRRDIARAASRPIDSAAYLRLGAIDGRLHRRPRR